jgi:hypothetical protein
MVVGVAHDDVLNHRAGPGVGAKILSEIPPTHDELTAVGNTRELPSSIWIEVEYEGDPGWVNLSYIAYAGPVVDMTADVVADLGGYPTNPTLTGLAGEIAEVFAEDEEPVSRVVQVTPVSGGSLGEVVYDVIGLADDSVRGLRLHIFAEQGAGGHTMKSVEARLLCGRGVSVDSCV